MSMAASKSLKTPSAKGSASTTTVLPKRISTKMWIEPPLVSGFPSLWPPNSHLSRYRIAPFRFRKIDR
ncbi:MAG: hypothetical protein LZF86_110422 [Nitrospira sp.]|nr:MAG: hypothetical protein LZF86_110422 [Nitrospira sp.]